MAEKKGWKQGWAVVSTDERNSIYVLGVWPTRAAAERAKKKENALNADLELGGSEWSVEPAKIYEA
jgi:hypothetical protein